MAHAMPWFPMYARDWLSGEGTSMMLPEQEGAFIRLLNVAWGDGCDEPSLPSDATALAQMSRLGARWKRLGPLVLAQFRERDGRLYNNKLSGIWREQVERSAKLSQAGRRGGLAKAGLKPGHSEAPSHDLANGCHTDTDTDTEVQPVVVASAADADESVVGEVPLTAMYLTIWCNRAVDERWPGPRNPFVPSQAEGLAARLHHLQPDPLFVRETIYATCRASKLTHAPKSPNYFGAAIESEWEREQARRQLAASGEKPPPIRAGPPRRGVRPTPQTYEYGTPTPASQADEWLK